jgi:phage-related protein
MSPSRNLVATFYRDAHGTQPVDDYIEALPLKHRFAVDRQIARINALDDTCPHLPHPYSSRIDGELRELRCHFGNVHYRILYRRLGRLVILLHMFRKKTAAVPTAEIELARRRWRDLERRIDAEGRSPLGGRAPRGSR